MTPLDLESVAPGDSTFTSSQGSGEVSQGCSNGNQQTCSLLSSSSNECSSQLLLMTMMGILQKAVIAKDETRVAYVLLQSRSNTAAFGVS